MNAAMEAYERLLWAQTHRPDANDPQVVEHDAEQRRAELAAKIKRRLPKVV
jgi:hypothetical protein